jgi:hypothetical protein
MPCKLVFHLQGKVRKYSLPYLKAAIINENKET